MTLLNPVPKHLLIKKKISICGSGRALLKLHVWRGKDVVGRGGLEGWGGVGVQASGFQMSWPILSGTNYRV